MHPTDADDWKNQVLEEVLSAVAANPELRAILIFKGARILAKLLPDAHRQSLDLDANCTEEFLATFPERDA